MKHYNAETLRMLDEGTLSIRGFMRFDFATATYCFWTGSAEFTLNQHTYLPGAAIQIDEIGYGIGLAAEGLRITLAASREDGLTPEILSTIENEVYHQRPVRIHDGYFHPSTGELIDFVPVWSGFVDTIVHTSGRNSAIIVNCESKNLDNNREGYRVRSTQDQNLVRQNDRIFDDAEIAGRREFYWGRERPK